MAKENTTQDRDNWRRISVRPRRRLFSPFHRHGKCRAGTGRGLGPAELSKLRRRCGVGGPLVCILSLFLGGCVSSAGGAWPRVPSIKLSRDYAAQPRRDRTVVFSQYASLVRTYGRQFPWLERWLGYVVFDSPPQLWEKLRYRLIAYHPRCRAVSYRGLIIGLPAGWRARSDNGGSPFPEYRVRTLRTCDSFCMAVIAPQRRDRLKPTMHRAGKSAAEFSLKLRKNSTSNENDLRRMDRACNATPTFLDTLTDFPAGTLPPNFTKQRGVYLSRYHRWLATKRDNLCARDRLFNGYVYAFVGAARSGGGEHAMISLFSTAGIWRGKIFLRFREPLKHSAALHICSQLAAGITLAGAKEGDIHH